MKWYINIALYILLTVNLLGQDCASHLTIDTDLNNSKIFIDDSLVTESNHYESDLDTGYYKITILENSNKWNTQRFVDYIYLNDCSGKRLFFSSSKNIYLDSNPQDAYVFMGDSLIGNTPLFMESEIKGITLRKTGYSDVNIESKFSSNNIKIDLRFIGQKKPEKFISTTAFKILAGTAIALGAITAYYKLKADDKFDEYNFSGDQKLLDQTRKFDVISGITFTAMQINLGFILYKFLTE